MKRTKLALAGVVAAVLAGVPCEAADIALVLDLGGGVRMEFVQVARGSFQQGSPVGEFRRGEDETPRWVTLTRELHVGRLAVTRAQYARFAADTGYLTEAERGASGGFGWDGSTLVQARQYTWRNPGFLQADDHPVTLVTWDDAQAFCSWLSRKHGRKFQLPTEAEWEYACRAGSQTAWHNGDDPQAATAVAWFKPAAANSTHPAGSLKPNAWSLHIGGNVHEWCRDWYAPYEAGPVSDPEQTNPNLSDKPRRVLRGGSWNREIQHTRSAARYRNTPASRNADNGFRVVAYLPPPTPSIQAESPEPTSAISPQEPRAAPDAHPSRLGPRNDVPVSWPGSRQSRSLFPGAFSPVFCLLPLLVLFFIVIRLFKSSIGGGLASRPLGPALPPVIETGLPPHTHPTAGKVIRTAADGFWIAPTAAAAGSLIRYRYWVGGLEETGQVLFQPGAEGHFVYTGSPPDRAVISNVNAPEETTPPPPVEHSSATGAAAAAGLVAGLSRRRSVPRRPPAY